MKQKPQSQSDQNNIRQEMPLPLSPQRSNLVGVFTLALGISAFVAVLYLGYVKFMHPAVKGSPQNHMGAERSNNSLGAKQVDHNELNLRKASLEDLRGAWRVKYGVNTATLMMGGDDHYEMVIYKDAVGYERLYSKGQFTYSGGQGTIRMKPSYDPAPDIPNTDIRILTNREYDVVVLYNEDNDDLLWLPYEKVGGKARPHPIFSAMGLSSGYIEWKAD